MTPSRLAEFLAKMEADVVMAMAMVKDNTSLEAYKILEGIRVELAAAHVDAVHDRTRYELEGKGARWK
jgi:hypothetical protein